MKVKSLVVISTNRGRYVAEDLVAAAKWSLLHACHVVVVDYGNSVNGRSNDDYTLLCSEGEQKAGFHRNVGVHWAIEQGLQFEHAFLFDDECLIINQGLDTWADEHLRKNGVGVVGAHDRNNYDDAYRRCAPLLDAWHVPLADDWGNVTKRSLHDAFIVLPYAVARKLYDGGLLCPDGVEQWPLTYGTYMSWVTMLHDFYQVGWGGQERQLPPIYVGTGNAQPAPAILSTRFIVYHSARNIESYTEEEMRELYKRLRGEQSKPVQPIKPVVSGRGVGEMF